jgi:hypothetical protein
MISEVLSVSRNRVAYAINVFCVSKSFGGGFRNHVVYAIMVVPVLEEF